MSPAAAPAVGLVVAKAPVAGQAKTRLAGVVGAQVAADLAAAALLDTLDACAGAFRCTHVALAGDLASAARGSELGSRLAGLTVHRQRGHSLGERLAHAHADVARASGAPVVQVGMDTPQVTAEDLREIARLLGSAPAVLGPAPDGGWWVLGLTEPAAAAALAGVEMSTDRTGRDTEAALAARGLTVLSARSLVDVDEATDADVVAAQAPGTRFGRAWAEARKR